ncbi:MAG: hypothetical protein R3F49_07200 [Planctomycetota bacterium]
MRPILGISLTLAAAAGCAAWKPALEREGWTLYRSTGSAAANGVSISAFDAALHPAFGFVEGRFGAFEKRVRVHAFRGAVDLEGGRRLVADGADGAGGVYDVPGIGPARVEAFHSRGGGALARDGVFLGAPDVGTAVHELIHAWYAERGTQLALWFEEGIATYFGDGLVVDGRWIVDGMSWWPLRELREELAAGHLDDATLRDLLAATPRDHSDVRRNVLVHFVGWAIVLDLARETGSQDWQDWSKAFRWEQPLEDARARLERTLGPATQDAWLDRLADPDPNVRMATAQGVWKLRSRGVMLRLVDALEAEESSEVAVCLAVNLLACAGELDLSWRDWRRISGPLGRALRSPRLDDPEEEDAARALYLAYRRGQGDPQAALRRLERFWTE